MDPYSVQSPDISRWVRPNSDFQDTGSFQADQSSPYNLSQVDVGNVFDKGAAVVEHDKRAPIQGPNLPRGNGPISNPPFQENAAVGLTTNGLTPLVNKGQVGNIQGAHQASATLFNNKSVTSVQNPQSSQGAAAPPLQPKHQTQNQLLAYIQMPSKVKVETEQKTRTLSTENEQLRTENQQMRSYIQQQDEFKHLAKECNQRLIQRISELETALQKQIHQYNLLRTTAEGAHYSPMNIPRGRQPNHQVIQAPLHLAHTVAGPNSYGPAAQNSILNRNGFNPVGATTLTTTAIVSSPNGPFVHQNGQPATPAIHNPLVYVQPAYSGKTYPSPPDEKRPQIIANPPIVSGLEAERPQAETIDLTLDELETTTPVAQIAANTTGSNEASNEHSRDHYVDNELSKSLGGPMKEPPWMGRERAKAKEQLENQLFAEETLKTNMKRKAAAEERAGKKAKTQTAVKATKPAQEKSIKKAKVPAKSKASANAKKHTAQSAADTALLDEEKKKKEEQEIEAEVDAALDAEAEKEERESAAGTKAELTAEDERERLEYAAEIGAEPGADAMMDLNAEPNENKQYKPDACIDPALLISNHDLAGQCPAQEAEETIDRPSSPADSLFNAGDYSIDFYLRQQDVERP